MSDITGMVTASQFSSASVREVLEKAEKAMDVLFQRGIDFLIQGDTGGMSIRVLVKPEQITAARDALNYVFPQTVRNLRMHTDSDVVLQLSKNLIKPGQTVLIGRSPATTKMPEAEAWTIGGDGQIANSHLAVEWDGFQTVKIKPIEGKVTAGGVDVPLNEWMNIEPGTKVRLGVTTLRFIPV